LDPGEEARKVRCDWRAGTLMTIPLNCWSQMVNEGPTPAISFSVTDAPLVLDIFQRDPDRAAGRQLARQRSRVPP
jgi:gentisate 1,2-dioxygenase